MTDTLAKGRVLLDHLLAGELDEFTAAFDDVMKQAMPREMVATILSQLSEQAGEMKEILKTKTKELDGMQVALFMLSYDNATVVARLVFNAGGQLAGFQLSPIE